jgi:hypothetical protein
MDEHERTARLTEGAKATITIVLRIDGSVGIMGPISNKMLCYGMLEMAKDAIREFKQPEAIVKPVIVPPNDIHRPRG